MEPGTTVYRIVWCDGLPFVQSGKVVQTGKDGRSRRCRFKGEPLLQLASKGFPTLKEALEKAINEVAAWYGPNIFRNRPPDPWVLAECVVRLRRLAAKLQKAHLLDWREG